MFNDFFCVFFLRQCEVENTFYVSYERTFQIDDKVDLLHACHQERTISICEIVYL